MAFSDKLGGGKFALIITAIVISLLGYVTHLHEAIPYTEISMHIRWLETAMVALPFFLFGYMIRVRTDFLNWRPIAIRDISLCAIGLILTYYLGQTYGWQMVSYYTMTYSMPLYMMLLVGIIGSIGFLSIARLFKHIPIVSYIGRYSIIVLITHKVLIVILNHLLRDMPYNEIIVFTGVILLEIPIIIFCKRYLPYLFAQKELLK